ncbi:hypothetical protein A3770_09p54410 [Chloropicon primus]|uniref:Ubiquitin-like domain-containing protein n=1 Tax=Chloropicon primus TaxID=1764295 RepID=A0A5B8MR58_9CHLO|nr:hypothetical protein A3770_09p54410 [Chloropicon primus]|eukprot:QDZ22923.1 hypothetical protein A3770_09p54410 [Chloropicon primus]
MSVEEGEGREASSSSSSLVSEEGREGASGVRLVIKNPANATDFEVFCPWNCTVGGLKDKLSEEYEGRPPSSKQTLIFAGKVLRNDQVLGDTIKTPKKQAQCCGEVSCGSESDGEEENFLAKLHLVVQSAPSPAVRSRSGSGAKAPEARRPEAGEGTLPAAAEASTSGTNEEVSLSEQSDATTGGLAGLGGVDDGQVTLPTPSFTTPSPSEPFGSPQGERQDLPPSSAGAESSGAQPPPQTPSQCAQPSTPQTATPPMSPAMSAAYDAALRAVMSSPAVTPGQQHHPQGFHYDPRTPVMAPYPGYMYAPSPYSPYPMAMSPWGPFFPPPPPTAAGFPGYDPALLFANQANLMRAHQAQFAPMGQNRLADRMAHMQQGPARTAEEARGPGQPGRQGNAPRVDAAAGNRNNNNANANGNRNGNNRNNGFWDYLNLQLTLKLFVLGIIINHDGSVGRLLLTAFIFMFVYMQQMGIFSSNGTLIQKFSAWYSSTFRRLDGANANSPDAPPAPPVNPLVRLFIEVQWFFMALLASLLPSFSAESFMEQAAAQVRPHQD